MGIIPWSSVLSVPVEIILFPSWFPFTLGKVSYWSRTTMVPMGILQALKRPSKTTLTGGLDELFCGKPGHIRALPRTSDKSFFVFWIGTAFDLIIKLVEPFIPARVRGKAIRRALDFCIERLNGLNGIGCISPPMQYLMMVFGALGYAEDHPHRVLARKALEGCERVQGVEGHNLIALSPVWDTALSIDALLETREARALAAAEKGLAWLLPRQIRDFKGDWAVQRPNTEPGGWAFYYNCPHYPDKDDTKAVLLAMQRMSKLTDSSEYDEALSAGTNWLLGMQSKNGGWGAYDADNTCTYLNSLPFAHNDSLLDPPTVDVSGGVISYLASTGRTMFNSVPVKRGVEFLLSKQELDGSWFGRWGVNYIYGTRLALCALISAGIPRRHSSVTKGINWLLSIQQNDGGWGESVDSYKEPRQYRQGPSTPSQTSWALLALLATVNLDHPAISAGIKHLLDTQVAPGQWKEEEYTGTGHPEIIYLQYQGYKKYFPLLALARFYNMRENSF